MGDNALTVASSGQDIPSSHHNELVTAFLQNMVPRNASRTAEDLAGALGTSALRWLRAYVETYHIGTASANLTISEAVAGEIHIARDVADEKIILRNGALEFHVNNVKRFEVSGSGIVWSNQPAESIPTSRIEEKAIISSGNGIFGSNGSHTKIIALVINTKVNKHYLMSVNYDDSSGTRISLRVDAGIIWDKVGAALNLGGVTAIYRATTTGNKEFQVYVTGGYQNITMQIVEV